MNESRYFSTTVLFISVSISGFVWYPPNSVASCEFQSVWFKNQAQLTTHLWRTCLQRIFQVFLQLMAITLYMVVAEKRYEVHLLVVAIRVNCAAAHLCQPKQIMIKQHSNDKASNYTEQNSRVFLRITSENLRPLTSL